MPLERAAPGEPGYFGKIPAQADFARLRAAGGPAHGLVLWLEQASEAAGRQALPGAAEPVRFSFRPPAEARALVGALADSTDKVGRRFPLTIFAPGPGDAGQFPGQPGAARPFFEGAEALLGEAAGLAADALSARVSQLPCPSEAALAESRVLRDQAAAERGEEMLAALFGDPAAGQRFYAAHCLRSACASGEGRPVIVDCPVRGGLDVWAWLEAVRRLRRSAAPTFFWKLGPAPRLLVTLGPPPPTLLALLWDPARRDAKLWPLTTAQPAAIETARRALGPAAASALERPASVLDVVSAIAGQE
jgi:type VI secretion system protein ImpM